MKLLDNMTVRLSWALVLVLFVGLIVVLGILGLYSVGHTERMLSALGNVDVAHGFSDFAMWIRVAIAAILIITVLAVAVVLWGVSTNVLRPLQRVVDHCEQMASGNLAGQITVHSNNEIGKLFAGLSHIQKYISETVSTVRHSSQLIDAGAQEIAEGGTRLSNRTIEQAASLENTASSMEELTSTVGQNADNARQASRLADGAAQAAKRGGTVMEDVVNTMGEINTSSRKVAEIIRLIDSIAFQTNILALNASVEAARAGEQGRGFAVVAGEVRSLASRSAAAAQEIRALINTSVEQVENGSHLVEQAGDAMREIVDSVQKVADIMDEIAAASQEQSKGISLVNQAVTQMDTSTQQNAGLVQDTTRSAADLVGEAQRLRQAVGGFRVRAEFEIASSERTYKQSSALTQASPSLIKVKATSSSKSTETAPAKAVDDWEIF